MDTLQKLTILTLRRANLNSYNKKKVFYKKVPDDNF